MRLSAVALAASVFCAMGCQQPTSVETIQVSLANTESYTHPTVGGDEEGARVSVQPQHSSVSEVRRNAETNWVATFVYQPVAGFVGRDRAEIEILSGSDGASPPTNVKRVVFEFEVHDPE